METPHKVPNILPRADLKPCISKNGAQNFTVAGKALHSRIDPQKEARRFLLKAIEIETPSIVLIVGESAGHLIHAAALLHPRAKILAIYPESRPEFHRPLSAHFSLYAHKRILIEQFLFQHILPLELSTLAVVEWHATISAYKEVGTHIVESVRQSIVTLQRNIFTTMFFGRKWLRNSLQNYLKLDEYLRLTAFSTPILITASGPSLRDAFPFIKKHREGLYILATSSSVLSLDAEGIHPNLIIHTDGGYWATHYLRNTAVPIATTLNAALGSVHSALLFSQHSLLENLLPLDTWHAIPENGSVTGSALWLGLKLSSGPIILAGLDCTSKDILLHTRPHAFDFRYILQSCRCSPEETLRYRESTALRQGGALAAYADWFSYTAPQIAENRLYMLPSNLIAADIPHYDAALIRKNVDKVAVERKAAPSRTHRRSLLKKALHDLRDVLEKDTSASQELLLALHPDAWHSSTQRIHDTDREAASALIDTFSTRYLA